MKNPMIGHYKDRVTAPKKKPLYGLHMGEGYSRGLGDKLRLKSINDLSHTPPMVYPWTREDREDGSVTFHPPRAVEVRVPFEDLKIGEVFRWADFLFALHWDEPRVKVDKEMALVWRSNGWHKVSCGGGMTVPMDLVGEPGDQAPVFDTYDPANITMASTITGGSGTAAAEPVGSLTVADGPDGTRGCFSHREDAARYLTPVFDTYDPAYIKEKNDD